MRVRSPLSNLSETITQVKESAAQYRDILQRNEAATRAVLIDPILRTLGWDSANIYMVEVEKSQAQMRVDYALYDRNASVVFVVEAKPLGTDLNDNSITMNIVKYAFNFQTKHVYLTDGVVWKHVTIMSPGDMPIDVVNFAKDSIVECAAYLVQHLDAARFWPEEQTIDELAQRVSQLESNLVTVERELSEIREREANKDFTSVDASPPTPAPPAPTSTTSSPISTVKDLAFIDLDTIPNVTGTTPSLLRLPDETIVKVRRWKDVLLECCKLALSTNPSVPIPLSDRAGKKVHLFDIVKPPMGISFIEEEYRGQTIYIYANYDANNCVANARHILKQVPSDTQRVKAGVIFR